MIFGGLAQSVGSMLDPTDPLNYLGAAGKIGKGLFGLSLMARPSDAEAIISGRVSPQDTARAVGMLQSGASPGRIFQETGLEQIPTKGGFAWGKSISDVGASTNPDTLRMLKSSVAKMLDARNQTPVNNITLQDVLNHPQLFKEYPELAAIPVERAYFPSKGYYVAADNTIGIQQPNPFLSFEETKKANLDDILQTLLHEAQHAIQHIEKWPRGGSPKEFSLQSTNRADAQVRKAEDSVNDAARTFLKTQGIPEKELFRLSTAFSNIRKYAEGDNKAFDKLSNIDEGIVKALLQTPEGKQIVDTQLRISNARARVAARQKEEESKYSRLSGEAQARAVEAQYRAGKVSEAPKRPLRAFYDTPIESLIYKDPFVPTIK